MEQQTATKLTKVQMQYIEYVASSRRDENGSKISMDAFASSVGVNRTTLYRWQNDIPDFWDQVRDRINAGLMEYVPQVMLAMKQKAIEGDVAAAKLLLNQANALRPAPKAELGLQVDMAHPLVVQVVNFAKQSQEKVEA